MTHPNNLSRLYQFIVRHLDRKELHTPCARWVIMSRPLAILRPSVSPSITPTS